MERVLRLCALALLMTGCGSVVHGCGQRCYPSSGHPPEPISSEQEAVASARCFTACLEKYAGPAIAVAFQDSPVWPAIGLATVESFAGGSCKMLSDVMMCSSGCRLRANNSTMRRSDCRQQCVNSCSQACQEDGECVDTYPGTSCQRTCKQPACNGGCKIFTDVVQRRETARVPPTPTSAPILMPSQPSGRENDAGLYTTSMPPASTTTAGNSNNITTFLFKVESENTSAFFTQEMLGGLLDLGYFACNRKDISFAAVNAYGRSNFSAHTEICISGESRFPSQPDSFLYTVTPDLREGFEGRAKVNITWAKPNDYEYISHYTIRVFSQREECGGIRVIHNYDNIHKDATHFILMAQSRNDVPGYDCNYQVTLLAKPAEAGEEGIKQHVILSEPPTKSVAQNLELKCHKHINRTTGKIALLMNWTLQASPTVVEAVEYYKVYVSLVDVGMGQVSHIPQVKQLILTENEYANGTTGGYLVHKLEPHTNMGYRFKARVTPFVGDSLQWMQVPDWKECLIDTLPLPPSPVVEDSINVSDFSIVADRLNLSMSWQPPPVTYGPITRYEVLVTHQPLSVGSSSVGTSFAVVYQDETPVDSITITEMQIHSVGDRDLCLHAQVRASNTWVSGDWSGPVTLIRYPVIAPNCTLLPSPTAKEVQESEQDLPLFIIVTSAGLGCMIVATALVLVVVVYLCKKHRTKRQMERVFKESGYQNPIFAAGKAGSRHGSVSYKSSVLDSPKPDEWELPAASVVVEEEIAEGCFGLVHRGFVKGPLPSSRVMKNSICETVAIKFLKRSASGAERSDFLNEIDTMKKVASGNNRFIVNLVGCVTIQEPLCLITEFVKHGDLLSYLQSVRKLIDRRNRQQKLAKIAGLSTPEPYLVPQSSSPPQPASEKDQPDQPVQPEPDSIYAELGELEPVNLISFAYQIASGMEYLASLDVVHRDLACRNILLGTHKTLKISDFGLSRHVTSDDVYVKITKGRLPWKWMAIESIVNREFTSASDVWAYGVTLWEIATLGGFPYPMITNGDLLEYLKRNYRLECPENCSRDVYDVMLECWRESPTERPTFTQLKAKFDTMLEEGNPYIHFDTINTQKPYYSSASSGIESDGKTAELGSESSIPSLSPSASNSEGSSGAFSGTTSSEYDLQKPQSSAQVVEVHLEVEPRDPSDRPPANAYVYTPTRPYDSAFDLGVVALQQTIEEDSEMGSIAATCRDVGGAKSCDDASVITAV